jgi:hypothetical protein
VPDNRRSSTRHDVELFASVTVDGASQEVRLQNLSLGGAFISYEGRLPMGKQVSISFTIPTQEQPIEVGGQVRWASDTGAGLQFDGLRARDVWSLNKYFEQFAD